MARIFISYSRKSRTIADSLANDLVALGEDVWFDEDLSGGQAWWNEILKQIRVCDFFVFVLDPDSLNSAACKSEYQYAADLGKPILPILVSDHVSAGLLPLALSQIQYVDYRVQDRKAALLLARAMSTIPAPPPLPNPLPAPPEVPTSYLGKLAPLVDSESDLTLDQQTSLVFQLKRGLTDPSMAQDTRTLLERFRSRPDLLATVAADIDELLRTTPAVDPSSMKTTLLDSPPGKRQTPGPGNISAHQPADPANASSDPRAPHPPAVYSQHAPPPTIPNNLVWAILSIFCCWPLAIVSIVYATQVNGKVARGDYAGAMSASKNAKTFAIIGAVIGILGWGIYLIFFVLAAASQNTMNY
jgi:TIR domain/Interferon-induced transmembrane protein